MEIDDTEFEALKKACSCNKDEITHFYQLMTFLENQKKITARDMRFLEDVFKKAKLQGEIPSILQSFKRKFVWLDVDVSVFCVIIPQMHCLLVIKFIFHISETVEAIWLKVSVMHIGKYYTSLTGKFDKAYTWYIYVWLEVGLYTSVLVL